MEWFSANAWWIIILAIVVIIVLAFISIYNSLITLSSKVDEAFSTMDVYMKKRYDLVPNLVATVKGYAAHEKDTLEGVVQARNACVSAGSVEDQLKAEGDFNKALSRLMMLTESYPDLKANQEFGKLMNELSTIEGEIAQSRKYYNAIVRQYNIKVSSFPSVIVAKMFGFTAKPYFEVSDAVEREAVQVSF